MPRLAIGIITWNNAEDAIECAQSLKRQTIADDMKIVIVDNDSQQSAQTILKNFVASQDSSLFAFVQTGYNGGTAGGFNASVRYAHNNAIEYVGSLNADAIADTRWCEMLLKELDEHSDTGIATGKMLHRDGKTIDGTGDFYTTWGLPGPRDRGKPAKLAHSSAGYIFGVTGGGFIARTSMYQTVGEYDEKMFMYYEDVDMSFRAQLAGFRVRYTPDSVAYHKRGVSSDTVPGLAVYNTFKNLPILFTKNVPFSLWPTICPRFALTYTLIFANAIKKGSGTPAIKGWLMSLRYIFYVFKERFFIQKRRKVSAQYISSVLLHDIPPEQTGLRKFRDIFKLKIKK